MAETRHVSVLAKELVEYIQADQGGNFLDCTFGGGGHARLVLLANPRNTLTAIDRDERAIERGREFISKEQLSMTLQKASFADLARSFEPQSFNGIYADLGTSMDQLFEERGFSFHDNSELDMRMDQSQDLSAADIVNTWGEQELFKIFKQGGVGSDARKIARAIIKARPIESTQQLAQLVASVASPASAQKRRHPATVVFQAIRIAVNEEFSQLEKLFEAVPRLIRPRGRFAVISFHSLEDKFVARKMRDWQGENAPANIPGATGRPSKGRLLTGKALTPSEQEIESNPSSRSARLRVFEFREV